jgi:hypothetical protein
MATPLLDPNGHASIATALMMSHHGLRRDLARFVAALRAGEARVAALAEEWGRYRSTLHHHHTAEDTGMFPGLASAHPEVKDAIEALGADHRRIDPLLERGDHAFADPRGGEALAVVEELSELLHAHLDVEERTIIGFLRDARGFPPFDDAMLPLYADGFAWSSQGIADDVLEQVYAMLPPNLVERLPAARAAFEERCARVWGRVEVRPSRTSVPA